VRNPAGVRGARTALAILAVVLGGYAEWAAHDLREPLLWIPDLLVGLAFFGAAMARLGRDRPVAILAALTAGAWFAGTLLPVAAQWHRGPLIHLLVCSPGWRPRTRLGMVAVAGGYVSAAVPGVWASETAAIVLGGLFLAVLAAERSGRAVRPGWDGAGRLVPGIGWVSVVVGGAAARLALPSDAVDTATSLAYAVVLCAVAGAVARGRRLPARAVADLVVELGESRSGTLRDALARLLGDPDLRVGHWVREAGRYVDADGAEVPADGSGSRVATAIDRDGTPFAVILHDRSALADPGVMDAVAAATRLTAAHAALQAEVRAQLAELAASRRRLVVAGDEERQRLERRLHEGSRRRLARLRDDLGPAPARAGDRSHLSRAAAQLDRTLEQLDDLARGLHPRELAGGLADGVAALVERSAVPVRSVVLAERFAPPVELAAYYVCAEALANVAKHAAATAVTIEVVRKGDLLVVIVTDDGRGGAAPARGSGLRGLTDRLEALGGRLSVVAAPGTGSGTRIAAELPLGGDNPTGRPTGRGVAG
jgi:signal transduction histidine kinase